MVVIYRRHPFASHDCAHAIKYVINKRYETSFVSSNTIASGVLAQATCVVFPGGEGDVDAFDDLLKHHAPMIRDYVAAGGRYLGICMGAYIASKLYFDLLGDVFAEIGRAHV